MSELMRHIGRVSNTGARVIVAFRKLPDDAGNCLVIESDTLPEMYHDNLMTIVKSNAAQDVVDFYEILHRNSFGDGKQCLQALHEMSLLRKVPVELVEMLPFPNTPVPLSTINEEIDKNSSKIQPSNIEEVSVTDIVEDITEDEVVETDEERAAAMIERADTMVLEAEERTKLMIETANHLKEEAYIISPGLRPQKRKAATAEKRAVKRRAAVKKAK